jgi:C1A family cysteine protease
MNKQIILSLSLASALVAPNLFASTFGLAGEDDAPQIIPHHNPEFLRSTYKFDLTRSSPESVEKLERKAARLKAERISLKSSVDADSLRESMASVSVPSAIVANAKVDYVDLRPTCSPVQDQRALGSCAIHALEGALEQASVRKTGTYINFSRLFAYFNARAHMGEDERNERAYLQTDSGLTITDAARSVLYGLLPESSLPYSDDSFTFRQQPLPSQYRESHKWLNTEGISFVKVAPTKQDIDAQLRRGKAVMFGMPLHESFLSANVARTGMVPMPQAGEDIVGGHAMLIVGVDDRENYSTQGCYIVRNSWSDKWGQDGYCFMPQEMILRPEVTYDLWRISDVVNIQKVDEAARKKEVRMGKNKSVPQTVVDPEIIEKASLKKIKRPFAMSLAKYVDKAQSAQSEASDNTVSSSHSGSSSEEAVGS